MSLRSPAAFLSYVRDDDAHDYGGVTKLRERLEGEVKVQTGTRFEIFQDRNDIRWGQSWKERIEGSLSDATFLIPIITPSFFASVACRDELEAFLRIERTLGVTKLVLPVYYISADQIENETGDALAAELKKRNWTDWRDLRFEPFDGQQTRLALATLAKNIKGWTTDLVLIGEAAQSKTTTASARTASALVADLSQVVEKETTTPRNPPWSMEGALVKRPSVDESYWVFTREFDEVIYAKDLLGKGRQSADLLPQLTSSIARTKRANAKLLQKYRSYTAGSRPLAVTLLCDNSGSMRGDKINATAVWVCLASEIMDAYGIPHEILGFTTRSWKGGKSREEWLASGKVKAPGRLCELRHVVYKSFDDNANEVVANCAVMLQDGILKENIDGEALLWANERLLARKESNRLLFVISDGAPVDDATLSVNNSAFLEKHLRSVVRWLEREKKIDLRSVGIEFSARYYSQVEEVDQSNIGIPIIRNIVRTLCDGATAGSN